MACKTHLLVPVLAVVVAIATPVSADPAPATGRSTERSGEEGTRSVVALLPLATGDRDLEIYGKPVADAVAGQLRVRFGDRLGVESVSLSGAVPSRVDLVVDGRIVSRSSGRVILEAQLRDPDSGLRLVAVATKPGPITEIDQLARELAGALGDPIVRELENLARRRRQRARASPSAATHAATHAATSANRTETIDPPGDPRPPMVVFDAVGNAAGGAVPVDHTATDAGYRLARSLGFRPVANRARGIVPPVQAIPALRQVGARYALMVSVYDIAFDWFGVLGARGKVRIALLDESKGYFIYNQLHRTDTLIGNRGDRHAALVRYVLDQARDIARPPLSRIIARQRREENPRPAEAEK